MDNKKIEELLELQTLLTRRLADEVVEIKDELISLTPDIDAAQKDGKVSIAKYFDRINDNLFSYNNLLVAVYFALTQFDADTSKFILLIPIANMFLLVGVNYYMMEYNRKLSRIDWIPINEINNTVFKKQGQANILSLLTIITTVVVTVILLFHF